ncbi:MAG: ThiF family adenylyltransferase, partial [Imperialibacter sp.]
MSDWLERTELLIGKEALGKLKNAHVLVVGLGGVGSYAAETLVRAGLGKITIIDGDDVDPTNKNRQLQALDSTVGQQKAYVLRDRFLDINPQLKIEVVDNF